MKIAIIGTGYVGLVTGSCLAQVGNDVTCVDIDDGKVKMLKRGVSPIYEPGLEEIMKKNIKAGRLAFTTDIETAVKENSVLMISVGTPPLPDGSADLSYIFDVAEKIGRHLNGYKVVVQKSTAPVGTAARIKKIIKGELKKRKKTFKFDAVSNPEFLKEGSAVGDFMKPNRVILGTDSPRAQKVMEEVYTPFMRTGYRIINMDVPSAELTKYAANSMLATRISFMNMLSQIAEKTGADIESVRAGIGSDPRIGNRFIFAGLGYGGSCFPKDVKAIIKTARELDCDCGILEEVENTNQRQRERFIKKITNVFGENLNGKTFAVWGLSFKPETDDVRDAPSLYIVRELSKMGAKIKAYDPQGVENFKKFLQKNRSVSYFENGDGYRTLKGADALLVLTEWMPFREPDFSKIKKLLKTPIIFDGRNLYDPNKLKRMGFRYFCFGR